MTTPNNTPEVGSDALFTADFAFGIAQRVASELFKNGFDEKGRRLVITTEEGEDLGGWSKCSVIDRIAGEILAVNIEVCHLGGERNKS